MGVVSSNVNTTIFGNVPDALMALGNTKVKLTSTFMEVAKSGQCKHRLLFF
jgi:hypothetical protein